MDTNAIISAVMQQLVDTVADAVIRKLKAEGTATVSLEPEALAATLSNLLTRNTEVREGVRDIVSDSIDNIDLCQISEFADLQRDVESMQEKIEEVEAAVIDADDSDFADAVRSVIRNNI